MIRVGQGVDIHPFDEKRPLILGGVRISDRGGLSGHSDADAVLHALTDALLGAAGAGDIGQYFPSNESKWKGVDSSRFVAEAKRVVDEMNAEISNVDITIIAEKPKLAPFREAMEGTIAKLLDISPKTVDTYRSNIMRKLGIHDLVGLVKFAINRNLTSAANPPSAP